MLWVAQAKKCHCLLNETFLHKQGVFLQQGQIFQNILHCFLDFLFVIAQN